MLMDAHKHKLLRHYSIDFDKLLENTTYNTCKSQNNSCKYLPKPIGDKRQALWRARLLERQSDVQLDTRKVMHRYQTYRPCRIWPAAAQTGSSLRVVREPLFFVRRAPIH